MIKDVTPKERHYKCTFCGKDFWQINAPKKHTCVWDTANTNCFTCKHNTLHNEVEDGVKFVKCSVFGRGLSTATIYKEKKVNCTAYECIELPYEGATYKQAFAMRIMQEGAKEDEL